jgi:hypothetical protein
MCRAALGESNSAQAQAVNDGIVYLMAVPYAGCRNWLCSVQNEKE